MQTRQTEVFHSVRIMLRKSHKVDCRGDRGRIGTKKLDLKSNCGTTTT